jgi:hypothetical protein
MEAQADTQLTRVEWGAHLLSMMARHLAYCSVVVL